MTTIEPVASVDHAQLLIIDPLYLPEDALARVAELVARGLAVLVRTGGDGGYPVQIDDDSIVITGPEYARFEQSDETWLWF